MRRALSIVTLAAAVGSAAVGGCLVDRDRVDGGGIHPSGYTDPASDAFHGAELVKSGYPLATCRSCHGDDYHGGSSRVGCVDTGCHANAGGPEACPTCHGDPPATGAHGAHAGALACTDCHPARVDARSLDHPDGTTDLAFGPLAAAHGHKPTFDAASGTCADFYCHLGKSASWSPGSSEGCTACHDSPPPWHARFGASGAPCATCHPSGSTHVDGSVEVLPLACDACHGAGPLGAPPPRLPESTGPDAHARHLDPSLPDRIGRIAVCANCHIVPATVDAPGHVDGAPPADVVLGSAAQYDATTGGCVVRCHGKGKPVWTDTSGAARACDGCHAFPPATTTSGAIHPPAAPDLATCVTCHAYDVSTHVDGVVDLVGGPPP
ncbi:MAG: hypothetical protein U0414_19760 [Polyangiaceae bacterium]